jgi:AraC-like DNA-binding protein
MALLQLITTGTDREQVACWGPRGRFRGKLYTGPQTVGHFQYASIADVGICRFQARGFFRSEPTDRRRGSPHCAVILQLGETVCYELNGQMVLLPPRHWIAVDQGNPASTTAPNGTDSLILMLPRAKVVEERTVLDAIAMRPFAGDSGVGKLAWRFIRSVFAGIANLKPQSEAGVADTICHLVRLAILESSGEDSACSQAHLLRERIKAYILAHLRDPELNTARIAAELNCTKRYLHKIFEMEEISLCDYIRRLRLENCRQEILASDGQGKSITEIGFAWGFNSSAYFSSSFKQYYGSSPSAYRKKELSAAVVACG